jgi:hypothetical protein
MWAHERSLYVVDPADAVRGAYAHRNTLGDAGVVVHGWSSPGLVRGLAPMALERWDAPVGVRRVGPRRWRLVLARGDGRFLAGPGSGDRWQVGAASVRRIDAHTVEVAFGPSVDLGGAWVLDRGRFRPLVPGH